MRKGILARDQDAGLEREEADEGRTSERLFEELSGLGFQFEAAVLMGLCPGERGYALHEIIDGFRRPAFLGKHRLNNLCGFRLREAAPAQERLAILLLARNDPFARRLDAGDEMRRRGVREMFERWRRLMGKPGTGEFRVTDVDLFEILDAPKASVRAHAS